jgi:hypothetical protein
LAQHLLLLLLAPLGGLLGLLLFLQCLLLGCRLGLLLSELGLLLLSEHFLLLLLRADGRLLLLLLELLESQLFRSLSSKHHKTKGKRGEIGERETTDGSNNQSNKLCTVTSHKSIHNITQRNTI